MVVANDLISVPCTCLTGKISHFYWGCSSRHKLLDSGAKVETGYCCCMYCRFKSYSTRYLAFYHRYLHDYQPVSRLMITRSYLKREIHNLEKWKAHLWREMTWPEPTRCYTTKQATQLYKSSRGPGLRRSSPRLLQQNGRTRRRRNSLACRVIKHWNRLPHAVSSVPGQCTLTLTFYFRSNMVFFGNLSLSDY